MKGIRLASAKPRTRSARRFRWIAIFALLLAAISTVPSFAAEGEPSQPFTSDMPTEEDVLKALRHAEKAEAEFEADLSRPDAVEEREDSATEFEDLTAAEAEALLTDQFGEQLEDLEGDPTRFLSDAQLIRPLGEEGATVKSEGNSQLLETTMPVRTEDEDGELHKVDLSLEQKGGAFEAVNPLVDLKVSASPSEGIELGDEGLGIAQMGIAESAPRRIGDMDIFYPEVATDTDLLVSAIGQGVELFSQLRSADSPRTLHFAIDLPAGAELRPDGLGGAEVVNGGQPLASIPKPSAVDAQDSEVPVSLSIEKSSITLEVSPKDHEVAYPLLVDPIIENWGYENWDNGYHLDALEPGKIWWRWEEGPPNWAYHSTSYMRSKFGPSGRGLYISSPSGNLPGAFAQWQYVRFNEDSYISSVGVGAFHRYNYNCPKSSYPLPYDFDGIWGDNNWNALEFNKANDQGWTQLNVGGSVFQFGLGQGNPISIPCWRDISVGGVAIWLDDFHYPAIASVSGLPTGWNDGSFSVTVGAWDAGLGIQFANIIPEGAPVISRQVDNCTGLSGARCPTGANVKFEINAGYFDQGIHNGSISVSDPTGKLTNGNPFQTKIDRTPPAVTLSGQLAQATNEVGSEEVPAGTGDQLSLPVYNLKIEAKDGSKASDALKRSGMKSIEVFLDSKGTAEQTWTQTCPESSCEMTKTYALKLQELASVGSHTLRVIATDQLGHKLERKIEFEYMPATGIDDDFVMQRFPLSEDAESENPDQPELAVNVMNGNLAYRQKDVEVDGFGVDLEVQRYYNSMLPNSENTEWGDGWTLGQMPKLALESGGTPKTAVATLETGAVKGPIGLPTTTGQERFDPTLQATITKNQSGYELSDESNETEGALAFSASGKVDELRMPGYAKVDYEYASGKLDEIAVDDPGSVASGVAAEPIPQALTYSSSFGGSEAAALKSPGDVAFDTAGNIWVVDKGNNRIEEFDPEGGFLSRFGTSGTAPGQLSRPTSLTFDANGDIWVADANNNRIQEFSSEGESLKLIGKLGTGKAEFSSPESIAADYRGHIWVADTSNGRLQELGEDGTFIKFVGSKGTGEGQLGEPTGVAIGPDGKVWVADWQNHRVSVFNQSGEFVRQFGTYGTGDGQFRNPAAVDVDSYGSVWVSDTANGRLQLFDRDGEYLGKFGSAGAGAGQFGFARPAGVAAYGQGGLWVVDPNNNRIQRWIYPSEEDDDPSVDVATSNGLVSEVTGLESGKDTYSYSGDDLVAQKGPSGETKYTYDSAGRMTKVQLPNGNYATIIYNTTYGRVSSVTTVIKGVSKKTGFTYSDEPRRTEVTPPNAPVVTYDIGADGSVLKWWNSVKRPEFHDLAGSFYGGRETETAIAPGDQNLVVEGYSAEGIASIQVIANGNQLLHETACEQDLEKPGTECVELPSEWVASTNNFPPGRLQLEIVITDRIGASESRRFWVNIPVPPPPLAEGTPAPPTFGEVLNFREEYGLDIVDPVQDEIARNDRIFNLIGAWWAGDPVARATNDRWGVPLRAKDVEELEYRERYLARDAPIIAAWGKEHASGTYSGFYIDHRAGGLLRVGFTQDQASQLEALQAVSGLVAVDRFADFSSAPSRSLIELRSLSADFHHEVESLPEIQSMLASGGLDISGNRLMVGATNTGPVESFVSSVFGSNGGVGVTYVPQRLTERSFLTEGVRARELNSRLYAGDWIREGPNDGGCTLAFGAREAIPQESGRVFYAHYGLTAGHCYPIGRRIMHAATEVNKAGKRIEVEVPIGTVERRSKFIAQNGFESDAEAIRLDKGTEVPHWYYWSAGYQSRIHGVEPWVPGMTLCHSGTWGGTQCGPSSPAPLEEYFEEGHPIWTIKVDSYSECGDSGSPVWNPVTGGAVALLTGGPGCFSGPTYDTPLLPLEGQPYAEEVQAGQSPGALNAPSMNSPHPLEIVTGG